MTLRFPTLSPETTKEGKGEDQISFKYAYTLDRQ